MGYKPCCGQCGDVPFCVNTSFGLPHRIFSNLFFNYTVDATVLYGPKLKFKCEKQILLSQTVGDIGSKMVAPGGSELIRAVKTN